LLIVLLIFAIPTVVIKDPAFIKWKVSVVNVMMAIGLLVCQFIYKRDVINALTGIKTPIPQTLFKKMTIFASIFLCLCAGLNYILAFKLPELSSVIGSNITNSEAENIWVNYKTYGNGIINFVFTIYLYNWMNKRLSDKEKEELEKLLMEHSSFKKTQKDLDNKED
jgi:intracellular septation protein